MRIKKIPPQVFPYMEMIPAILPGYLNRVSGGHYGAYGANAAQSTRVLSANKIYAVPFLVLKQESFNLIQTYVSTGSAGNARMGIYADNGNYAPGSLVLDAGEIDTTTTGVKNISINQVLSPGLYWMVLLCAVTPTVTICSQVTNLLGIGGTSIANVNTSIYITDQAYGELPATHPTAVLGTDAPLLVMRKA